MPAPASPPVERAVAIVLVAMIAFPSCARALREPPPLAALARTAGAHGHGPGEVASLLAAAERHFSRRTIEEAREAEATWLAAAAADESRIEGLLGAARAGAWLADHEAAPAARLAAATKVLEAAQWCKRIAPADPACDYWLGAGLGLQARERPSTALSALPRIVEAFERAASAAPSLDDGGPERALALVYARAPGWPTGPGDPDLALLHARKAVALRPEHPPNLLALAESLAATGDADGSRKAYAEALARARERVESGDPDASDWVREAESAASGGAQE